MKPISRFLLLSGVMFSLGSLAACSTMPKVDMNGVAMMNQHLSQPFYVNAASISVEDRYNAMANPKDVSSTMPTALDKAIKSYAESRFNAAGSQGVFHYVIEDASVFQEDLPPNVKMGEFLGLGNQTRYTGSIRVNIYRDGSSGVGPQGYEMKVERTVTMQADVSLQERDQRLTAFITDLLNDIDKSATDKITNVLMLSAVKSDLAPSPGPYPPTPVDRNELQ
jgi:hypothetical protein